MDQLVLQVTDEVTKSLQPLLSNLGSLAQQAQSPPSTSSQAPAVSLPVDQSTSLQSSGPNSQQAQGHAAIQETVKVPSVHDGVQSVLAYLSGEQNLLLATQRPNDVFMSVTLQIDARIPAKIRSKIIQMNLLILAPFSFIQLLRTNFVSHSNPPRKALFHHYLLSK